MLVLKIGTENAAFRDPYTGDYDKKYEGEELCRILKRIIERIEDGSTGGRIFDLNGNHVGNWRR